MPWDTPQCARPLHVCIYTYVEVGWVVWDMRMPMHGSTRDAHAWYKGCEGRDEHAGKLLSQCVQMYGTHMSVAWQEA